MTVTCFTSCICNMSAMQISPQSISVQHKYDEHNIPITCTQRET